MGNTEGTEAERMIADKVLPDDDEAIVVEGEQAAARRRLGNGLGEHDGQSAKSRECAEKANDLTHT